MSPVVCLVCLGPTALEVTYLCHGQPGACAWMVIPVDRERHLVDLCGHRQTDRHSTATAGAQPQTKDHKVNLDGDLVGEEFKTSEDDDPARVHRGVGRRRRRRRRITRLSEKKKQRGGGKNPAARLRIRET